MPSSGDNLSLGGLGFACGINGNVTSLTRLAADGAGTTSETQMSDFFIEGLDDMTIPDTTPNESTSATATVTFVHAGSLFNTRIRTVNQNFTWAEVLNAGSFVLTTASDYTAPISFSAVTSNTSISFNVTYKDSYNNEATLYNTAILETAVIQETGGGTK